MTYLNSSDWREDLESSRDVNVKEKAYIDFVVNWLESWRLSKKLDLNRDVAREFWREAVCIKECFTWQMDQWSEGMRWYLSWIITTVRLAELFKRS